MGPRRAMTSGEQACCHFFQFSPLNKAHNLRSPWCAAPDANKFRLPRTCAGTWLLAEQEKTHEQNLIVHRPNLPNDLRCCSGRTTGAGDKPPRRGADTAKVAGHEPGSV